MTEKEKMFSGELYLPGDENIMKEQLECLDKLYDFNLTRPSELEKRTAMLKEMFAEIGDDCYIEPPLHSNWGGKHCHFGKGVYANFNLTLVDDTHIYVGDYTLFGPNVVVATAGHPIHPELREKTYQYNFPVRIGIYLLMLLQSAILAKFSVKSTSMIWNTTSKTEKSTTAIFKNQTLML